MAKGLIKKAFTAPTRAAEKPHWSGRWGGRDENPRFEQTGFYANPPRSKISPGTRKAGVYDVRANMENDANYEERPHSELKITQAKLLRNRTKERGNIEERKRAFARARDNLPYGQKYRAPYVHSKTYMGPEVNTQLRRGDYQEGKGWHDVRPEEFGFTAVQVLTPQGSRRWVGREGKNPYFGSHNREYLLDRDALRVKRREEGKGNLVFLSQDFKHVGFNYRHSPDARFLENAKKVKSASNTLPAALDYDYGDTYTPLAKHRMRQSMHDVSPRLVQRYKHLLE